MNLDFILYILAGMIFYDFSLHAIEFLGWDKWFMERKNLFSYYYPVWKGEDWRARYTRDWTIYWGVASVLILTFILI